MSNGIVLLTADHLPLFADPAACDLLGFATLSQLQDDWPNQHGRLAPLRDAVALAVPTEVRVETDSGARRLHVDVHALGESPGSSGHLLVMRDRADAAALETDLRLASMLRSLSRLSRSMLHDLKSPLNAIVLSVHLLRALTDPADNATGSADAPRQRALGVLLDAAGRLNRALEELFGRTLACADPAAPFDLREIVAEIEAMVRSQVTLERIALDVATPDTAVALRGHPTQIRQAILNVVINAVDAVQRNGRVTVEVAAAGSAATVTVRDDGGGIPANLLGKLGTTRLSKGDGSSGIGLYVARSVLAHHGGTLSIDSTPGAGTTVRITLPRAW